MSAQRTSDWRGIYPAALTMFLADGTLDEAGTAAHLDYLVQEGAHGLVVAGTSGEFIALSNDERCRLIQIAVETVRGRVPVIVGTGYYGTAATTELTRYGLSAGADGALVILPYYMKPSLLEIMRHFTTIGASSALPVMLYNNPGNSGAIGLGSREIRLLHAEGSIRAVKSTFPTVHQVNELVGDAGSSLRVFYGSFMAPLEALAAGAHGWISGILNVVLPDAVLLWSAVEAGDLPTARAISQRILAVRQIYAEKLLGDVGDLAIYRGILTLRGLTGGWSRLPLQPLNPRQMETLAAVLAGERA